MTEFLQDPIRWSVAYLMLAFIFAFLVTGTTLCIAVTVQTIKNFPDIWNEK